MRVLPTVGVLLGLLLFIGGFQNCSLKGAPENTSKALSQNSLNCLATEVPFQGVCHAQYLSCTLAAGGSGVQEFTNGTYSPCLSASAACPVSNHLEANVCVSNKRACAIVNGTGVQDWNGTAFDACIVVSCDALYVKEGNTCSTLQTVYRFSRITGLNYFWSLIDPDPMAASLGFVVAGGPSFKAFPAAPAQGIPIYRCIISLNNAYLATSPTCASNAQPVLLGYALPAEATSPQSKPLYRCNSGTLWPLVTVTNRECGLFPATVIGHVY